MKHIYILDNNFNGTVFGVGTYLKNLIRILKDEPILVTMVTLFNRKESVEIVSENNIRYIHIPAVRANQKSNYYYRNVFYILYPYIDPNDENILHMNYRKGTELFLMLKEYFHFKFILTWHYASWIDYFSPEEVERVMDNITNNISLSEKELVYSDILKEEIEILSKYCDHLVVVANHASTFLCKYLNFSSDRISLVYNALPDHCIRKLDKLSIKQRMHISSDEKIILFVGRLDDNKNLSLLVRAFNKVFQNNEKVCLMVVGKGNYDLPLYYAYPNNRNIIFTGFIDQEELNSLYEIADIGVIPSIYEEFGYVLVEMMMHGLPVIANNTTGMAEIIENGISGILLDLYFENDSEKSIDLLRAAITELLTDDEKRRFYSINAYERYINNFQIGLFKQKMLEVYRKL